MLAAQISLTLSRHSSLSFIALGRSSGQQPVSSHSCWMYVRAGRPAFDIQVRRTRHAGHCWRSRDELIRDVLLWIPTHGRAKAKAVWLYPPQKSNTPKKGYSGYETKIASDGEAHVLNIREVWSTASLPLLPGLLWPGVVAPDRVLSMGQIDLFKNYSYSLWILDDK